MLEKKPVKRALKGKPKASPWAPVPANLSAKKSRKLGKEGVWLVGAKWRSPLVSLKLAEQVLRSLGARGASKRSSW